MTKIKHSQIFLHFLNNYKQLTNYELLILKNLFEARLQIFDHEKDCFVKVMKRPIENEIERVDTQLPDPTAISFLNGKTIDSPLLNNAKLNYDFVYKLCDLVISDVTLRTIKDALKISYKTAFFWRYKIFVAIEDYIKL